jgi:hypothetical protein
VEVGLFHPDGTWQEKIQVAALTAATAVGASPAEEGEVMEALEEDMEEGSENDMYQSTSPRIFNKGLGHWASHPP